MMRNASLGEDVMGASLWTIAFDRSGPRTRAALPRDREDAGEVEVRFEMVGEGVERRSIASRRPNARLPEAVQKTRRKASEAKRPCR